MGDNGDKMMEQQGILLGTVDELIQGILKESKKPLSTYELAKQANISWSTASTHCYKLRSFGIVDGKNEEVRIGIKRIVWWLTR